MVNCTTSQFQKSHLKHKKQKQSATIKKFMLHYKIYVQKCYTKFKNPNTILNSAILFSVYLNVKWENAWHKFQLVSTNPMLLIF